MNMIGNCSRKGMGIWLRNLEGEWESRLGKINKFYLARSGTSFMSMRIHMDKMKRERMVYKKQRM